LPLSFDFLCPFQKAILWLFIFLFCPSNFHVYFFLIIKMAILHRILFPFYLFIFNHFKNTFAFVSF